MYVYFMFGLTGKIEVTSGVFVQRFVHSTAPKFLSCFFMFGFCDLMCVRLGFLETRPVEEANDDEFIAAEKQPKQIKWDNASVQLT